ncbi:hypothetical protein Tco_1380153, partial [Tanacetum coccineum]
ARLMGETLVLNRPLDPFLEDYIELNDLNDLMPTIEEGEVQFRRASLTGFPAKSDRSSNAYALDSLYLLVLNTGTSHSRQHDMSKSDSYYLSD